MKFSTKLAIFFELKNHSYSSAVDKLINAIIAKGEFIRFDTYCVVVSLNGQKLNLWSSNRWYADLSDCFMENVYVYRSLRPSRMTQIRFWEWVEKSCHDVFMSESERFEKRINALIERESCTK